MGRVGVRRISMGRIAHDDIEALEELNIHDPLHYHKKRIKYKKK